MPVHTPQAEGLNEAAIKAFEYNYEKLTSGANLMVGEDAIAPVADLPSYDDLKEEKPELLTETVMLKLNGGLGTGMGLEKAKSLLPLKGDLTFLDFIALQVSGSALPCPHAAAPSQPQPDQCLRRSLAGRSRTSASATASSSRSC